jgi:hypothetical protein
MNKEEIYDTRIQPLMAAICEIVKKEGIAMFASFDIPNDEDPTIRCTTHFPDGEGVFSPDFAKCLVTVRSGRGTNVGAVVVTKSDGSKQITSFLL